MEESNNRATLQYPMNQPLKNRRDLDLPSQQSPSFDSFKVVGVCCLLVLAVFLVYGQTINHEFIVCDDEPYIYGNPEVRDGFQWKSWTDNSLAWCLTTSHAGNWHPLTWFSHILDAEIYKVHNYPPWKGPEAGSHHMTSVLLHALAAVFLFLALRRMTDAFWCSALVAVMFAIHPTHVESVAWGAERKDVLSGLFWMLTLYAYANYALRPNVWRYLAIVVAYALGLMSKSMLVTLPCVLLLLDVWPLGRWRPEFIFGTPSDESSTRFTPQSIWWLLLEKLPLAALSACVCGLVAYFQRNKGCMTMIDAIPLDYRLANAAISGVAYLWKTAWPVNLAIFYPHSAVIGGDAAASLPWYGTAAALLLAAITAATIWNLRRRPYLAVGWFWYLGTLVPVIGLIQVGAQAMADRYTYIPTIGIYIMVVWGGAELAARVPRFQKTLGIVTGTMLISWTVCAIFQVGTWENSRTVFEHSVKAVDDNYFGYNHLGLAYGQLDRPQDAAEQFIKAVRIAPSYDASNANLGVYYANTQQYDKALECFRNAARVNSYAGFHQANLGGLYLRMGRIAEAEAAFQEAVRLTPESPQFHMQLATALIQQGKYPAGVAKLRAALELSPGDPSVMTDLAWCLATCPIDAVRNGKEAVELARQANNIFQGRDQKVLYVLAAAYAETGQFDKAVQVATAAKAIAEKQNNQLFVNMAKEALRAYGVGMPIRERLSTPPQDAKSAPVKDVKPAPAKVPAASP